MYYLQAVVCNPSPACNIIIHFGIAQNLCATSSPKLSYSPVENVHCLVFHYCLINVLGLSAQPLCHLRSHSLTSGAFTWSPFEGAEIHASHNSRHSLCRLSCNMRSLDFFETAYLLSTYLPSFKQLCQAPVPCSFHPEICHITVVGLSGDAFGRIYDYVSRSAQHW